MTLKKTLRLYLSTEVIRFILQVYVTIKIFTNLDVIDYAEYAIIQSICAVLAIFFTLNIDSSMQKVFSRLKLIDLAESIYLNLIFIISLCCLALISLLYLISPVSFSEYTNINLSIFIIIIYGLTLSINSFLRSYFNATKKTIQYNLTAISFPLITSIYIYYVDIFELKQLIFVSIISYFLPVFLLYKRVNWKNNKYFRRRKMKIIKYIFAYSLPSFPALGSKLILEFIARISILSFVGEIGVATLAFINSFMSIFRSIEQTFFRAVTPFMIVIKVSLNNNKLALTLIKFQSIITIIIFSFTYFWLPLVEKYFESKPSAIFDPTLFILMALIYLISLWKNYTMIFFKKEIKKMTIFLYWATLINILTIFSISFINLTPLNFLTLLVVMHFISLVVVSIYARKSNIF